MPPPHPPEFRRRAVELAREVDDHGNRVHPIAGLAQVDVDEGRREGLTTNELYEWRHAQAHPCRRRREDAELTERIREIHRVSRRAYGSPRVHAELVPGEGRRVGRKRIERLMRTHGIVGIHRRRRACTRRDPQATPADDLVDRRFDPDQPDRLWVADVTEHPTAEGKVYLAVVLDAFGRMVLGWSIAEHMRPELVVDALQMALWRRRPSAGQTVHHSDHGEPGQYTSWAFGRRLRAADTPGCWARWAASATPWTTP